MYYLLLLLVFAVCYRLFYRRQNVTHAGGVVYRQNNGIPEILLVTAKNDKSRWVLPKGHVEPGEDERDTAVREVLEEAGIQGEMQSKIGEVAGFKSFYKPIRTSFYLVKHIATTTAGEGREILWLPLEAAIEKASRAEQRKILRMAPATSFSG